MRILWVTPSLPCPTTGNRARQFNLIKQLSGQHEFTVVSFVHGFETGYLDLLSRYCAQVVAVPIGSSVRLGRWTNRIRSWGRLLTSTRPVFLSTYPIDMLRPVLVEQMAQVPFDCVNLETLHTAILADSLGDHPVVFTNYNVEARIQYGRFRLEKRAARRVYAAVEWLKLHHYEARQLRRMPVCVVVGERDALECQRLAPTCRVHVVPNGVDNEFFRADDPIPRCERAGVLYVGTMDYEPNVDGALFFCRAIWPRVRRRLPATTLTIAGANPGAEVVELARLPGVHVTGFVDDIRPHFWQSSVCVVPLRSGGGTRLKILEAMAAGLPVVSTTIGAEGLDVRDGEHLLIADEPNAFARAVIRLLGDSALGARISATARRLVEARYDWKMIAGQLDRVYQTVAEQ